MVPATWTLVRKTGTTRRTRATRPTPTSVPRRRAPGALVSSTTFRSSGRTRRRTGCPTCSSAAADAMGRSAPAAAGRCARQTNPRPTCARPCQTSNQVTPSLRLPRAAAVCAAAAHRSPRALAAGQGEPGRERRLAARRPARRAQGGPDGRLNCAREEADLRWRDGAPRGAAELQAQPGGVQRAAAVERRLHAPGAAPVDQRPVRGGRRRRGARLRCGERGAGAERVGAG